MISARRRRPGGGDAGRRPVRGRQRPVHQQPAQVVPRSRRHGIPPMSPAPCSPPSAPFTRRRPNPAATRAVTKSRAPTTCPCARPSALPWDFLNRIGIGNIERRLRMLSDYLRQALLEVPRLRLLTSLSHDISSPGSTIFEFDGIDAARWRGPMEEEAHSTWTTTTGTATGASASPPTTTTRWTKSTGVSTS